MTAPIVSVCSPWATTEDVCSPCDDYDLDADVMEAKILAASEFLYERSGRRFPGSCQDVVYPCKPHVGEISYIHGAPGRATGILGAPSGRCSCGGPCVCRREIALGLFPVTSVDSVELDADGDGTTAVLDASLYQVNDFRYLERLDDPDGTNPGWPSTDPLFEVTVTYGVMPPNLGVQAAADLGCQMYLACQPELSGRCRLPERTQQVVRAGVTITTLASADFLADLKLSVPSVGLFLEAYNPAGLQQRARAWSPDLPRASRRIAT